MIFALVLIGIGLLVIGLYAALWNVDNMIEEIKSNIKEDLK